MRLSYHGTPAEYFDVLDQEEPYVPQDFERDGFIHCTDGERRLAVTSTSTAWWRRFATTIPTKSSRTSTAR